MGYVVGSQSAADPTELAGAGAMSQRIWEDFVRLFADSKGWTFTPDPSALLSSMLRHVLLTKGVNSRTGTDQLRFYDATLGTSHLILAKEFLTAADTFWRERYQIGFSIQDWCIKFEEVLWSIWCDDTNRILVDVKSGTKHSTQWALTNGTDVKVGIPAWVPVGYLFPTKLEEFNLLVARSPVANTTPGVEVAKTGRLINTTRAHNEANRPKAPSRVKPKT
jgi:hypothetical protein